MSNLSLNFRLPGFRTLLTMNIVRRSEDETDTDLKKALSLIDKVARLMPNNEEILLHPGTFNFLLQEYNKSIDKFHNQ